MIQKNPFAIEKYRGKGLYIVFNDSIYYMDGTSKFIWEQIGFGIKYNELLDILLNEYEVEYKKAKKDLDKLLKKLKKIKLLEGDIDVN